MISTKFITQMNQNKIAIELSKDEALVFFEFLGRISKKQFKRLFEDQADQRVLWNIEANLEKQLSEPFQSDYLKIITKAIQSVRDKN